ncbi:hypothetical protein SO802_029080 [Lithocarpus litseifolius]|uniref:Uncharacterized protein n=1 Tax=Lithocarpus litseifolius TaxID=425828 RepID=A0AAW2BU23_9ROSI
MPDSNRNWKGRYFFVKGTDWMCHLDEWETMPHGFDNTWDIVKYSEMEAARQRVRVAAARKKEEEKKAKLGESSSALKAVGVMATLNPVTQEDFECRLLTHKNYAVEMLDSIIKDKDADPCVGQALKDLRDSGLFDLAREMVCMKALQVKGVANEGVIARQQRHIKNLTDGQNQYKEALCILNQEVKELKEKLEEEGRQRKKDQEAKETAEKELTVLLGQMETTKVDAINGFKELQTYIDSCAEYYGVGFKDCLKQVKYH